jgi:hypothetical protein
MFFSWIIELPSCCMLKEAECGCAGYFVECTLMGCMWVGVLKDTL